MEEIRVSSWADLQEQLFADSWHPQLQRFRSDYAYRGRNDVEEDLRTSLLRLGGNAPSVELHLLRNFRKYAQRTDVPFDSVWNWLALAQHHGLPTRLLDWTYSPYVAVHFATSRNEFFDRDGIVWMVDYVRAQEQAPSLLRDVLRGHEMNVFTAELLAEAAGGLRELEGLADEDYVLFLSRQARPGEHHRACALPGPRRPLALAGSLLRAAIRGLAGRAQQARTMRSLQRRQIPSRSSIAASRRHLGRVLT